jgi:hypothetical protein
MGATRHRRLSAMVGAVIMAASSIAMSDTTTLAVPPVSSGLREISADLTGGTLTITRVCDPSGFNQAEVDVEADIVSDFLGTGTLSMDENLQTGGRFFEIETNKGTLAGLVSPVTKGSFVPEPSPHIEYATRYDLSVIVGTDQFAAMSFFGGHLETSPIFFESNLLPPPACDETYDEPIVGVPGEPPLLSGALSFEGRGSMNGTGSGTASLLGDFSTPTLSDKVIDETSTVEFPSIDPCDGCRPTEDHGTATVHTTFTTQPANDWFAEQLGVDPSQPNSVEIVGPDRDNKPGPDWTLTGYVYRSGFGVQTYGPPVVLGLEREIRITSGTGEFAQVSTGVLYYQLAQYTLSGSTTAGITADVGEFMMVGFIG